MKNWGSFSKASHLRLLETSMLPVSLESNTEYPFFEDNFEGVLQHCPAQHIGSRLYWPFRHGISHILRGLYPEFHEPSQNGVSDNRILGY
jgi:hypothetical protein